jgi:hypothetical protein
LEAWKEFRAARDRLFREHPQSPLTPEQRSAFQGLKYYPYDPAWRVVGTLDFNISRESFQVELPEGLLCYTRIARARFATPAGEGELSVFWIAGYGGGLFLPFRDSTSGGETYGGGRYLYDTIKGADLGTGLGNEIVLDFNYAYNPSCAYSPQWLCPLAPPENTLPFPVEAGEKIFRLVEFKSSSPASSADSLG